ncbi:hypothetical protein PsYK624_102380 [Phanerochaete sordida]|uniref:Uncharacterized protein n=1 Tax=Phanerochaete sordida TaxID=48140 RepID=A0A9P3GFR7_9APHY|nr:hypothetical protein PsYK624_102380 [Phanerochaete sordida]
MLPIAFLGLHTSQPMRIAKVFVSEGGALSSYFPGWLREFNRLGCVAPSFGAIESKITEVADGADEVD